MELENATLSSSDDFASNVTLFPYATLSFGLLGTASESTSDSDFNIAKAIPMTIVYALIFITGIFGNFCTCAVIARNKHMHTATNFYLFSLAMSDLLLLVLGLPQEMFQLWVPLPYLFGETFCVIRGLAAETSTNASILTITSFTMERYLAICHPLRAHTMSKLSRAVKLIILIWVVAAVCAVPQAIQFGLVPRNTDGGEVIPHTEDCSLKMPLPNAFELSTLFFFLLPMSLITVLYLLIGVRLRDHVFRVASSREAGNGSFKFCSSDSVKQRNCVDSGDHNKNGLVVMVLSTSEQPLVPGPHLASGQSQFKHNRSLRQESCEQRRHHSTNSRRAVVKMLVAVVVAFFVCWAPFHAQRLMAIYAPNQDPYDVIYEALTYVSGVLYYVSATVNPILYHIMSHKFRSAFKVTLGACCNRTRTRRRSSSLSNCHKNNSVYNYHSTVRSRVGTENTETTLETLLRDELVGPGAVTGATPDESNGDKSTLNGNGGGKTRTNHRHHRHRARTANGSSKSAYKSNLISKSGSSSFSSSSVSSSTNSDVGNKNCANPFGVGATLEEQFPIVDADVKPNKDEMVIEMEEFLKMNNALPIKSDGENGNYVSLC